VNGYNYLQEPVESPPQGPVESPPPGPVSSPIDGPWEQFKVTNFHHITPTLDNKWRAIVLFGDNSATYKFALASCLLDLAAQGKDFVTLADLAGPFSKRICDHIKNAPKQKTGDPSEFLRACKSFNEGELDHASLLQKTVQLGFKNVIDAFHIVNKSEVGSRFFIDERKPRKGIKLTDELFRLRDLPQSPSLPNEVDARWRLVETAWEMGIAPHHIEADNSQTDFYCITETRRKAVTSCRHALNGYQKGHCFYCPEPIVIGHGGDLAPDVDHFFPWMLERDGHASGLNGVWNLVLACRECNRGTSGKFARVPSLRLVGQLHKRNTYLIDSHHPLRETLISQCGSTTEERRSFLQRQYSKAVELLQHTWDPAPKNDAPF
jgi:hypothetical protein